MLSESGSEQSVRENHSIRHERRSERYSYDDFAFVDYCANHNNQANLADYTENNANPSSVVSIMRDDYTEHKRPADHMQLLLGQVPATCQHIDKSRVGSRPNRRRKRLQAPSRLSK